MSQFFMSMPLAMSSSSVVDAFLLSNFAGQVIVISHVVISIFAWSLMLSKWNELSMARKQTQRLLAAYGKTGYPIDLFLTKEHAFDGSPAYAMYVRSCHLLKQMLGLTAVNADELFVGEVTGRPPRRIKDKEMVLLRNVAEETMAEQALALVRGMSMMALVVSVAPMLGLLGTVWGVMEAFGAMASGGSAMLSAVAPGISGALLTTVTGLLVALPAAVMYNILTDYIRESCVKMEAFLQTYMGDVEYHYRQPAD